MLARLKMRLKNLVAKFKSFVGALGKKPYPFILFYIMVGGVIIISLLWWYKIREVKPVKTEVLTENDFTIPDVPIELTPTANLPVILVVKEKTLDQLVKPPVPKTKATTSSAISTDSITRSWRNPLFENNPLFGLYDKIVMGVSTDEYFVEGVKRINSERKNLFDRAFIKYKSGNAVPGLRLIFPRGPVVMNFVIYFGDNNWQEIAEPGVELHLVLRSHICPHNRATVREARYVYVDCLGVRHEYPPKIY